MRYFTLITVLLVTTAASANAQSVKTGVEASQVSDYAPAVEIWRRLAAAGDADAAFNLGQAYRLGRGVPIDLAAAKTWLELAARKGHVDAQSTLGQMQYEGGDRAAGLAWLKSAAEKGEARALLIYGTALFNGSEVARDPVLAYAYVSRAAEQGLEAAKTTLAQMDRTLPRDQRQKALALAQAKTTDTKPEPATTAPPPPKAASAKKPPKQPPAKQPTAKQPTAKQPTAKQPTASPASAAKGGWRIQLGAFSRRGAAEALFKQLSGSSALAGRQPFFIAAGTMTRLQAGPFESRAAAAAACTALSAKGQPCFPVIAK